MKVGLATLRGERVRGRVEGGGEGRRGEGKGRASRTGEEGVE